MTGTGAYAVNAVNPAEFKSYWDFVNPRWKGKIVARDIRIAGPGGDNMRFFYHHPALGPKFIHRLFSEMDLTLTRDFRQGIDWLGQGKFPLAIFFSTSDVKAAARQGLPVELSTTAPSKKACPWESVSERWPFENAPHPNAAKVFINWYLSRKAQTALQKDMTKVRRRTGFSQDRHPEGRRRSRQPKGRRGELYDHVSPRMDGHEAHLRGRQRSLS